MQKIIHSIEIEDFRSFDSEKINLEDVTCLVGANESGKTNLLDAIYLTKIGNTEDAEDLQVLRVPDIRKNSQRYPSKQLPTIKFDISGGLIKNIALKEFFVSTKVETISVIRNGNILEIDLPKADIPVLKNISPEPLQLSAQQKNTEELPREGEETKTEIKSIEIPANESVLLGKGENRIFRKMIADLVKNGKVQFLTGDEALQEIHKFLLKEVQASLKLFFWSYDKKYSLPDMVTVEDIKNNLKEMPVIKALFKLGGYAESDVSGLLEGRSGTDYLNLFETISKNISNKVRSKWRTNKNLEIKVSHQVDHILINVKEPGYSIEPKYRSEGLRWFLAFIIGMISQAEELKGYIILIDEPALHLHPGGQKDVLEEINKIAEENQVVYSTHSHFMIDRRYKHRVKFLIKTKRGGYSLTEVKEPTNDDILRDPLLRSSLGYSISDISYLNEINILVEGNFDKKVIETFSGWILKRKSEGIDINTINNNEVSVINCNGAGEIAKHAKLYKASSLFCLSIYDSDKIGKAANKGNNEQRKKEKIETDDIIGKKSSTIEDLIPKTVFKKAVSGWSIVVDANNIKVPRMVTLNKAMDQFLGAKNLAGYESSEERMKLKHELEDKLLAELITYLRNAKVDNAELSNLLALNKLIVERIVEVTKS